jgi:hypothetical protein
MQRLDSPSLTPTSQQQGTASGNDAAMTAPGDTAHVPVGTQPQPTAGAKHQAGTWVSVTSN